MGNMTQGGFKDQTGFLYVAYNSKSDQNAQR